eukprot:8107859-Alexandrium_andersonii.AAC.1
MKRTSRTGSNLIRATTCLPPALALGQVTPSGTRCGASVRVVWPAKSISRWRPKASSLPSRSTPRFLACPRPLMAPPVLPFVKWLMLTTWPIAAGTARGAAQCLHDPASVVARVYARFGFELSFEAIKTAGMIDLTGKGAKAERIAIVERGSVLAFSVHGAYLSLPIAKEHRHLGA